MAGDTTRPGMTDPFSLAGKVAVVTGSTRGIGQAAALRLARQGAAVVVSSRKAEAVAATVAAMAAEGLAVAGVAAHAAREDDIRRVVDTALERFGRLDIAVANAGINPSFDRLTDLPEESWNRILDTNVTGPLRLARHALPHIARGGGGAMVMVSSINAHMAMVRSGAYGVSKAALEHLARQLAVEWGPQGVRVNAVSPGTVRTDMIRALMERPGYLDGVCETTPLGRIGEPEDIAAVIAFLASPAARHMTGQVLVVDGGQTMTRGKVSTD